MSDEERFYSDDDPEHGISREQLEALPEQDIKPYIIDWFFRNFEDPAHETPYQSSEGGYIYVWGGPYDAREEIENYFAGMLNDEAVEAVVDEVEADGTVEWAPGRDHPDHAQAARDYEESMSADDPDFESAIRILSAGGEPAFGSAYEIEQRKKLAESANTLLESLAALKGAHGGMGHNGPPTDDEGNPIPTEFEEGVREAAEVIKEQAAGEAPDALEIAKASSRLQILMAWLGPKSELASDEFAKSLGKTMGVGVAGVICAVLGAALSSLLGVSWDWLQAVLPIF